MLHHVEVQGVSLLLIAALVAMGARWLRWPYTLALVVAGLVLGFMRLDTLQGIHLDKDLLFLLFLPALLFEAALNIDVREFRREAPAILVLAVPGVMLSVALTAFLFHTGLRLTGLAPEVGLAAAFLFASVIAATDPVSVLALFRNLGVPRRLYLLVEGESLLNDGVAVVVFVIVAAVVGISGEGGPELVDVSSILIYGIETFVWMAGGGVLVGIVVGGALSALTRSIDDHLVETTLTTIVAYGSFLIAEQLHASGVLATVAAGVVTGSFGRSYGMSPATRVAVDDFWEYAAFLANSLVFLLVGIEIMPGVLLRNAGAIGIGFVSVLVARAVVVYTGVPLAQRFVQPIPWSWRHVMVWGGLRGGLSMVLILALPPSFPGRSVLIAVVFGVVAASLFLQGLTISRLLARLGVRAGPAPRPGYEKARLRALAARDALSALARLSDHLVASVVQDLRKTYEERLAWAEQESLQQAGKDVKDEQLIEGIQQLSDIERDTVRNAASAGLVDREVAAALEAELDERREAVHELSRQGGAVHEALDELFPRDPS